MPKGRNEKAQLYSQIFVYLTTIIVVSLILVYGYKSIQNFRSKSEEVACLKFRNDLRNSIDGMLNVFDSIKAKDFSTCPRGNKICFVETFNQVTRLPTDPDPIMKDSITDNTGENVFIIEKITRESFYIGNISVSSLDGSDVLCIASAGERLRLKMESLGSHVVLSRG